MFVDEQFFEIDRQDVQDHRMQSGKLFRRFFPVTLDDQRIDRTFLVHMHQIELIEEGFVDFFPECQLILVDVLLGFQQVSVGRDPSVFQDAVGIADVFQFLQVVGRNDDRRTGLLDEVVERFLEIVAHQRIESVKGFVQ